VHNEIGPDVKIAHVITTLEAGGAQRMLYKLAVNSQHPTWEYAVVALSGGGVMERYFRKHDIPIHPLGMQQGVPSIGALRKMNRFLREWKPDLIQGWMYHSNVLASTAGWMTDRDIPVLWNVRHSLHDIKKEKLLTQLVIWWSKWSSSTPETIIYNSAVSARQHENIGFEPSKTRVIPNGFDLEKYRPDPIKRACIRAELGISDETVLIGKIARYHPMKDHENFLRAAAKTVGHPSDIHFLLVGSNVDHSNKKLDSVVKELGLGAKVTLLGERHDIPAITAALDIATLASAWGEGFPNVVGEAMATGIPCVVTEVGDASRAIGSTGKVCPPSDSDALASAWKDLVDLGKEGRRKLGDRARERVEEKYSVSEIIRRYESLYSDTMEEV
jgi:glycosyltransferase involved in cell wall biosynthesis